MIIETAKLHGARCPMMNGLSCMGPKCALWRALDDGRGYCGAGGNPTPAQAPAAMPPIGAEAAPAGDEVGRVPRRTTKASPDRRR